jgi:hypothetical protein
MPSREMFPESHNRQLPVLSAALPQELIPETLRALITCDSSQNCPVEHFEKLAKVLAHMNLGTESRFFDLHWETPVSPFFSPGGTGNKFWEERVRAVDGFHSRVRIPVLCGESLITRDSLLAPLATSLTSTHPIC